MKRDVIWFIGCSALALGNALYTDHALSSVLRDLRLQLARVESNAVSPPVPGRCVAAVDDDVLRAEIRRALKGLRLPEASIQGDSAQDQAPPETPDTPDEIDSEAIAAFDAANKILDSSLRTGTWGPEARRDFGPLLGKIDEASRKQMLQRLFGALNSGKLVTDGDPLSPM